LLVEFLQKMLNKDPNERATVRELIKDPWLTRDMKHPLDIFEPTYGIEGNDCKTSKV
jgi:serine/threonine protein kinase